MNRIYTILLGIGIVLMGVTASCKKEDYREKYAGAWSFEQRSLTVTGPDTSVYEGEITLGDADDEIEVQFGPVINLTVNVDESGELSGFEAGCDCERRFTSSQRLEMTLDYDIPGTQSYFEITGEKRNLQPE